MSVYPRNLVGYGPNPPQADWPGGARLALQFVLNYEEGGENSILHGDAASESFLSEIVAAQPLPGVRHISMESLYDYGARVGVWRILRLFERKQIPLTIYAVAMAAERHPQVIRAMVDAGHEIASHGYRWINYQYVDEAIRIHREVAGKRPLGFYQGRTSEHSLGIVMQEQGFLYSADSYADELPYWVEGPHGPHLIVPYTLDANDMRFATAQGFNSGDQFFAYLKDSFDVLVAEGGERPKMMSVGLHCRLAGRPGRAAALARFLDYVQAQERVWVATRLDIARHWIRTHAPAGGYRPSRLPRALFMERFGDIFEHTPQIAEGAHRACLPADADTADGLHRAFVSVMQAMSRDDKLALIKRHPDLAGRLAQARQMTTDSTTEQGSAGLDRLTEDELRRFTTLNDAYKARFGFPFILAVRGRTKNEIIASFETRLKHDADAEFAEALRQIERITLLRLKDRLP